MTTSKGLLFIWILLLFIFSSCSRHDSPVNPSTETDRAMLSSTTEIAGAYLHVWVDLPNRQNMSIHRISADWDANSVTWNSFASSYSTDVSGTFSASTKGWYAIDITDLVTAWTSGEQQNYGLLISQTTAAYSPAVLLSSERYGYSPYIELRFSTADGTIYDTLQALADVFIDQSMPTANTEGNTMLMVAEMASGALDKQALIHFDIPTIVQEINDASVASHVWNDANKNGVLETEETGFAGVMINLLDCENLFIESAITDSTGSVLFDSLAAGDYRLKFSLPPEYVFSPADAGQDDNIDSDADPLTGLTVCFTVAQSEQVTSYSAGIYYPIANDSVCTHGKGFWKNHSGLGHRRDLVSHLLPIWIGDEHGEYSVLVKSSEDAKEILEMKSGKSQIGGGIQSLTAHLLTAKLNIAYGAPADDIEDAIVDADNFLASHDWFGWKDLNTDEKRIANMLKDTLEQYNSGEIGPGSCD